MIVESFMMFLQKIMFFSSYIKNCSSFPKPLTPEEEREYLEKFENGTVVDAELLRNKGIIGNLEAKGLKVLGNGSLTKNLTVRANKFTESAIEKIKQAGGSIEVL